MTEEKKEPNKKTTTTKKKVIKKKIVKKKVIKKKIVEKPVIKTELTDKQIKAAGDKEGKRIENLRKKVKKPTANRTELKQKMVDFFGEVVPAKEVKKETVYATKCTHEIIEGVTKYIRMGSFIETACLMNNISYSAYKSWMRLGARLKDDAVTYEEKLKINQIYEKFYDAISMAEAESETHYVKIVAKEAQANWNAARFMLSQRFRKHWNNAQTTVTHQGSVDSNVSGTIEHQHVLSIDEKRDAMKKLMDSDEALDAAFTVLQTLDGSNPDEFYASEEAQKTIGELEEEQLKKEKDGSKHGSETA